VDTFAPIVVKALAFDVIQSPREIVVDLTEEAVSEDDGGKMSQCEHDLCDSILAIPGALWAPSFSRVFRCLLGADGDDAEIETTTTGGVPGAGRNWAVLKSLKWRKLVAVAKSVILIIDDAQENGDGKSGADAKNMKSAASRILNIGANVIHLVNATVADVCSHFFGNDKVSSLPSFLLFRSFLPSFFSFFPFFPSFVNCFLLFLPAAVLLFPFLPFLLPFLPSRTPPTRKLRRRTSAPLCLTFPS
jgi:hypothetical protein